jgi:hypothetical protein
MSTTEQTNSLASDKDGLPELAGERGPDHALVELTNDGPIEREPEKVVDNEEVENSAATDELPTEPRTLPDNPAAADDDDSDDEEPPQPLAVAELPEDFDWRKLKPRVYGKSLPPLDPVERQSLEESIVSHGILGKLLIDQLLNIVDGNNRWEICVEKGIVPPVEMISGLTDEEKEELALSCNLDRRQLDKEDAVQVREARLENMFQGREKNKKKFTLTRIARAIGVSVATVSLRWRERQNSRGENASIGDARQLYGDDLKSEAVRLVEMGLPVADVTRLLPISRKAVERAVKQAKDGKGNTAAATESESIEDIAASEGVPELHRRALKFLVKDTQDYIDRLKAHAATAQEEVEKVSDIEELLKCSLFCSMGLAFAELRLRKMLSGGGDNDVKEAIPSGNSCPDKADHEPGSILLGTVMAIETGEVFVALPVGAGVIDNRDNCFDGYTKPEVGKVVRVRAEGFDSKWPTVKCKPLGRQTPAPALGASVTRSDRDDRCSPDKRLAGLKAGPKETEVTK